MSSILRSFGYQIRLVLPKARVPITTFYDQSTNFTGDICIMNRPLALYRSRLVDTYRRIDGRLSDLLFTIRHLAKKYGIWTAGSSVCHLTP